MIRVEPIDCWRDDFWPMLTSRARSELARVPDVNRAFSAMDRVWVLWEGEWLLAIVGVTKGGGPLGAKPELWALVGKALASAPVSTWKELRQLFKTFRLIHPRFCARIAPDATQSIRFARFLGLRCTHEREAYNYFED